MVSHFLTPVPTFIDNLLEFCNNICVYFPFEYVYFLLNWEPKEFAFPVNGTGVTPQVEAWSDVGQREQCQLFRSHGGENNAPAPGDPSSPPRGGNKFQDGFSLLRNRSDRSLDVLADRGMLVRSCS